jgi:hypothetical protein
MLWTIYQGLKKSQWLTFLLAFTFISIIATLHKGQFAPLILIGLTRFLLIVDKINDQI